MTTLYAFPPTRSNRAQWALEELGLPYDSHIVNLEGVSRMPVSTSAATHWVLFPYWKPANTGCLNRWRSLCS